MEQRTLILPNPSRREPGTSLQELNLPFCGFSLGLWGFCGMC